MEDDYHVEQNVTIHDTLAGEWEGREDIFIGFNMSVYYAGDFTTPRSQLRKVVFRGPDIFICLGARPLRFRRSWVVANEGGKYPDVIFETLSRSTKKSDRGEKKGIYEKIFKTPEYFMVDPEHHLLEAFRHVNGVYVPIAPDAEGRCWSERMGLFVKMVKDRSGLASFARFFRPDGTMVPTGHEKAAQQSAKAEQERQARENAEAKALRAEDERQRVQGELQRAEDERQRVQGELQRAEDERVRERQTRERLEEQLRKLGIDPCSLK